MKTILSIENSLIRAEELVSSAVSTCGVVPKVFVGGMLGCGKSHFAEELAQQLKLPFLHLDSVSRVSYPEEGQVQKWIVDTDDCVKLLSGQLNGYVADSGADNLNVIAGLFNFVIMSVVTNPSSFRHIMSLREHTESGESRFGRSRRAMYHTLKSKSDNWIMNRQYCYLRNIVKVFNREIPILVVRRDFMPGDIQSVRREAYV